MSELKPCPFCGAKATMVSQDGKWYHPVCTNSECGCDWKFYHFEKAEAVKAWNTRIKARPDCSIGFTDSGHVKQTYTDGMVEEEWTSSDS